MYTLCQHRRVDLQITIPKKMLEEWTTLSDFGSRTGHTSTSSLTMPNRRLNGLRSYGKSLVPMRRRELPNGLSQLANSLHLTNLNLRLSPLTLYLLDLSYHDLLRRNLYTLFHAPILSFFSDYSISFLSDFFSLEWTLYIAPHPLSLFLFHSQLLHSQPLCLPPCKIPSQFSQVKLEVRTHPHSS